MFKRIVALVLTVLISFLFLTSCAITKREAALLGISLGVGIASNAVSSHRQKEAQKEFENTLLWLEENLAVTLLAEGNIVITGRCYNKGVVHTLTGLLTDVGLQVATEGGFNLQINDIKRTSGSSYGSYYRRRQRERIEVDISLWREGRCIVTGEGGAELQRDYSSGYWYYNGYYYDSYEKIQEFAALNAALNLLIKYVYQN